MMIATCTCTCNLISSIFREIWSSEKKCGRLPDFVIVGPQKTGTTALHWFLSLHPKIFSSVKVRELDDWISRCVLSSLPEGLSVRHSKLFHPLFPFFRVPKRMKKFNSLTGRTIFAGWIGIWTSSPPSTAHRENSFLKSPPIILIRWVGNTFIQSA